MSGAFDACKRFGYRCTCEKKSSDLTFRAMARWCEVEQDFVDVELDDSGYYKAWCEECGEETDYDYVEIGK